MSSNNFTSTEQNTTISSDNARRVTRLARQRQSTEDISVGLPTETSIDGSTNALFDDDGNILNATKVVESTPSEPVSLEEWLENANEDRYQKWKKAVENNMFPDISDEQLLNKAVQNELEDPQSSAEMDLDTIGASGFVINEHQNKRQNIWNGVDNEAENVQEGDECPECGSTNTSSYQQQTGGADEGMTSFHKCADCDHSWRGGYGG